MHFMKCSSVLRFEDNSKQKTKLVQNRGAYIEFASLDWEDFPSQNSF